MAQPIKAILLDIEGTTTPIDFVHKTLFPYSREKLPEFVRENFTNLKQEIVQLKQEHSSDPSYDRDLDERTLDSVIAYLNFLIENDRKSTPLKSIQGKIWQKGYESGDLHSVVFDDVPKAFELWRAAGVTVAIYSSGSIQAQKDLFKHTDRGDLTPYISAYFDTTTGGKKHAESYSKIATELAIEPEKILFVSDVLAELDDTDSREWAGHGVPTLR